MTRAVGVVRVVGAFSTVGALATIGANSLAHDSQNGDNQLRRRSDTSDVSVEIENDLTHELSR